MRQTAKNLAAENRKLPGCCASPSQSHLSCDNWCTKGPGRQHRRNGDLPRPGPQRRVYDSSITQQVPNGRGGTKQCNTTGTATNDGYSEHAFNWEVALRIRDALNQMGARTQLSREDDNSIGPCVNQRAALANAMHPDAIVSIHADGGPPTGHGFHVNYSSPPVNASQGGPAVQLAHVMRDSLVSSGLQEANYIGSEGLYGRADLAGLNLAEYPAILVELGNMKNGDDAARMRSADGRTNYAAAVTDGIVTYLSGKGPHN